MGELDDAALRREYERSHVVVTPSHHEGFGVPVIEGLTAGCYAIAADAGSLPEVVGPFGLTFPVGDAPAMADRICRFLADLRPSVGGPMYRVGNELLDYGAFLRRSTDYVAPFLPASAVARYFAILERLAADHLRSPASVPAKASVLAKDRMT